MKEFAIRALRRQVEYEQLWALRAVDLEVYYGEVFGVIGPNGAGKSTLMKVVARVLPPTEGRVRVRGSVAAMIELGAGFNGEMTGEENVILYGSLLGRDSDLVRSRVPEIAEWAGLEGFMDVPIRSYSSGMLARLGFAVATDEQPDVLVVDEVLSVGDAEFQDRSRQRIDTMMHGGTAVLLVSHDMGLIAELAERSMYLDHGQIQGIGPSAKVIEQYLPSVD